jgi:ammonium transporter
MIRAWRKWSITAVGALALFVAFGGTAFAQDGPESAELVVALDTMWLLVAAFLVFFMQAGFALLESGFTRSKNTVNVLMKNLMDFAMAALAFWAIVGGLPMCISRWLHRHGSVFSHI